MMMMMMMMMMGSNFIIGILVLIATFSGSASSMRSRACSISMKNPVSDLMNSKNSGWLSIMTGMVVMMTPTISINSNHHIYSSSNRVYAYEGDDMTRFASILNELEMLDNSWDTVVMNKGDNIRRKLGTVYTPPICSSPLCGVSNYIPKYVKTHYDDLDVVSFEDPSNRFLQAYNQADFLAYSSMFADYGNGGGTGTDYIELSHEQVKKAIEATKEMIQVISSN